jgi:hypothetical protein
MASVTLDFDAGQIAEPLEPDIDDLGRVNVVVAKRRNGSEVTASDTDGPLGTDAIGTYRSRVDVNPETDDVLPQHASYHLILGTDPDPRYPEVSVELTGQDSGFIADVSAIDIGDLISLQNIPPELGQAAVDLLARGYTETIGSHRRVIAFNTRPGGILTNVGQLDGGASACLQTAGAHCSDITAEARTFNVATDSGPVFTTSPPAGAQIVVNDREVMTVTAISGASSPQTFTVIRDPDQRVAHAAGSSVKVYRPLRLTL